MLPIRSVVTRHHAHFRGPSVAHNRGHLRVDVAVSMHEVEQVVAGIEPRHPRLDVEVAHERFELRYVGRAHRAAIEMAVIKPEIRIE